MGIKIPGVSRKGKGYERAATEAESAAFARQAAIVTMRELDGMTFAEIGRKYGFTAQNARALYLKGKRNERRLIHSLDKPKTGK